MRVKQGEVVLVLFPDSNGITAKYRPALVVQSDNLNTGIDQFIVAMITSKIQRAGHGSRILVQKNSSLGQDMGLRTDSLIMTDNLATVRDDPTVKIIGRMTDYVQVEIALRHTFGL
jgi:mRNA interferase MazF